jgi:hypothetical protein
MPNSTLGWTPTSLDDHNYYDIGYVSKNRDAYRREDVVLWNKVSID